VVDIHLFCLFTQCHRCKQITSPINTHVTFSENYSTPSSDFKKLAYPAGGISQLMSLKKKRSGKSAAAKPGKILSAETIEAGWRPIA
jgi:hypothetical protein